MNCPNCHAPVAEYDRFCENCGSYLADFAANPAAEEAANSPYAAAVSQASGAQESAQAASADPAYAQPVYDQPTYEQPAYGQGTYAQPTYAQPDAVYAGAAGYGAALAPATAFGLAVASLVMGILGLLSFGIVFFLGIVGIILGIVALAQRSSYGSQGKYDRHAGSTLGLGIAGIITNALAIVLFCGLLMLGMAVAEDEDLYSDIWDDYGIEEILDEIDA